MADIRVDIDGNADAKSLSEAVRMAEGCKNEHARIFLAPGVYREKIEIRRGNLELIGEDAEKTIIVYEDYGFQMMPDGEKRGTFRTASCFLDGDDIYVYGITFMNDAGWGEKIGQALAMYADGDRLKFEKCRFIGRQDTIFTAPLPPTVVEKNGFRGPKENAPRKDGTHYYKECYIEGDVDFIFGGATAYFENCEIFSRDRNLDTNGYITAASTPQGKKYGYVFEGCRFTSDCAPETVYLGRPWREYAKTVIMNSELGAHIKREGWHDWNKEKAHDTAYYAEYKNYGEGADTSGRCSWSKQLTDIEAAEYTKEKVLWQGA